MHTRKRIPGCLRCRERHVKCDRAKPACSSCRNLKYPIICEYASECLRFRQSRYSSSLSTTNTARREADSAPTSTANDSDPGAAFNARYATRTEPSTFQEDESRHRSTDWPGPPRTLPSSFPPQSSAASPVPPDQDVRHFSSPSQSVTSIPLTPKPSTLPFQLPPLGAPTVDTTSGSSGYGVTSSSALIDLPCGPGGVGTGHVSPNTMRHRLSRSKSRTLTDDVDCKVFAFYVECAGHWVCTAIHNIVNHS